MSFMPMIAAKKETIKNAENGENTGITTRVGEDNKNPWTNLAHILCI